MGFFQLSIHNIFKILLVELIYLYSYHSGINVVIGVTTQPKLLICYSISTCSKLC